MGFYFQWSIPILIILIIGLSQMASVVWVLRIVQLYGRCYLCEAPVFLHVSEQTGQFHPARMTFSNLGGRWYAATMVRRAMFWHRCIISTLDLLAQPHTLHYGFTIIKRNNIWNSILGLYKIHFLLKKYLFKIHNVLSIFYDVSYYVHYDSALIILS